MKNALKKLRLAERGASLVEYALLVALIAAATLGAVSYFGKSTDNSVTTSGGAMSCEAGWYWYAPHEHCHPDGA